MSRVIPVDRPLVAPHRWPIITPRRARGRTDDHPANPPTSASDRAWSCRHRAADRGTAGARRHVVDRSADHRPRQPPAADRADRAGIGRRRLAARPTPPCPPLERRRQDVDATGHRRERPRRRLVRRLVGCVHRSRLGQADPGQLDVAALLPSQPGRRRDLADAQGPDLQHVPGRGCGGRPTCERPGQRGLHRLHDRQDLHPHEHERRDHVRRQEAARRAPTTRSPGGP